MANEQIALPRERDDNRAFAKTAVSAIQIGIGLLLVCWGAYNLSINLGLLKDKNTLDGEYVCNGGGPILTFKDAKYSSSTSETPRSYKVDGDYVYAQYGNDPSLASSWLPIWKKSDDGKVLMENGGIISCRLR